MNRISRLFLIVLLSVGLMSRAKADEILVSAAASLTDALNEIGKAFTQQNPGTTVRFNFASSGALQRQIEQGAPVDVFVSAGVKEMDALQKGHHIEPATRTDFASNRLVLIAPIRGTVRRWEDLASPQVKHIALSDPGSVPSGRYAQETLTHRGLWNVVRGKAVFGENVRQTLTYVVNGDADAGLVFLTDALIAKNRVRVVAEAVPGKDHAPIVYPAAVVTRAPNAAAARRFVDFLNASPLSMVDAQYILAQYGFIPNSVHIGAISYSSIEHVKALFKANGIEGWVGGGGRSYPVWTAWRDRTRAVKILKQDAKAHKYFFAPNEKK